MVLIQHLNAIHRYDDIANLQAGTLRWRLWLNGSNHNRLGAVYAKSKLTRIAFNHNRFVNACVIGKESERKIELILYILKRFYMHICDVIILSA